VKLLANNVCDYDDCEVDVLALFNLVLLFPFSVVKGAKHSGGSSDPDGWCHLRWQIHMDDEVGRLSCCAK